MKEHSLMKKLISSFLVVPAGILTLASLVFLPVNSKAQEIKNGISLVHRSEEHTSELQSH